MTKQIFINYRNDEGKQQAQALYFSLRRKFSKSRLFMDHANLEGGQAWLDVIEAHVANSFVLLALIGPDWLNLKDKEGIAKLSQPTDPVRYEIATALRRRVPVIPVLLDDAKLPSELELPLEMRGMLAWHAMPLRFSSFDDDAAKLTDALVKHRQVAKIPRWALGVGTTAGLSVGAGAGFALASWLFVAHKNLAKIEVDGLKVQLAAAQQTSTEVSSSTKNAKEIEARARQDVMRASQTADSERQKRIATETRLASISAEYEAKLTQATSSLKDTNTRETSARKDAQTAARDVERIRQDKQASDDKIANLTADLNKTTAALQRTERDIQREREAHRADVAREREKTRSTAPVASLASPYEATRFLQQRLHALGYYQGAFDGVAGDKLYDAMRLAFVDEGSAAGSGRSSDTQRYREFLARAQRDPSTGGSALASFVTGLVENRTIPPAPPVHRPDFAVLDINYRDREVRRDGSFPVNGEHVEIRLNFKGPEFERFVVLDNGLSIDRVELCKRPCSELSEGSREKKAITRREFAQYGHKYLFRTSDGFVNKAGTEFDDVLWMRLTHRSDMTKSFNLTLVYRQQ